MSLKFDLMRGHKILSVSFTEHMCFSMVSHATIRLL